MIIQKRVRARNKNQAWNLKRFYRNIKQIALNVARQAVKFIGLDSDEFDTKEQIQMMLGGLFGASIVVVMVFIAFLEGGN